MSDFFQEVTEELRSDQLRQLWRRFGKYVIGIAVAIIVATAVNVFYSDYRTANLESVGDRYMAATDLLAEGDLQAAMAAFGEIADTEGGGYGMLARFEEANGFVASGETREAIAAYTEIADDGSVPTRLQQLASLAVAVHLVRTNQFDSAEARLAPLMVDRSTWRNAAKELYAFSVYSRGDAAAAGAMYMELSQDLSASAEIRARSSDMLAIMSSGRN